MSITTLIGHCHFRPKLWSGHAQTCRTASDGLGYRSNKFHFCPRVDESLATIVLGECIKCIRRKTLGLRQSSLAAQPELGQDFMKPMLLSR